MSPAYKERYISLLSAVKKSKAISFSVVLLGRIITAVIYIYYPLALFWLIFKRCSLWLPFLAVPAAGFAAVSLLRAKLNFKRPYEQLPITPLYKKETRGKSFPSRHVFSAFVIAAASLRLSPVLGGALLALGAILAVCRVLSGVHYPKDVLFGAALGTAVGSFVWIF